LTFHLVKSEHDGRVIKGSASSEIRYEYAAYISTSKKIIGNASHDFEIHTKFGIVGGIGWHMQSSYSSESL